MPPSRGPQLRSVHLTAQLRPPPLRHSNFSPRSYSTRLTAATPHQTPQSWRGNTFGSRLRFQNASTTPAISFAFCRNQSTAASSAAVTSVPSPSTSPPTAPSDALIQDIGDIASVPDISAIPEGIGYLKALGLDFSWYNPSAPISWALEHMYVYTGLPWWGAIVATAVCMRTSFLWFAMKQSDMMARLQAFNPVLNEMREKQKDAARRGDSRASREGLVEMKRAMAVAGIKQRWIYLPLIGNAVLGIGAFRLMRLGARLPVPSWEHGGFSWVTDLTIPDPYYVLPIIGGVALHIAARIGGETGANRQMSTIMRPLLLYAGPAIFLFFACFQPAAFQLTMLVTVLFGIAQGRLFQNMAFREWAGMHPIVHQRQRTQAPGVDYKGPQLNLANMSYQPPNQTVQSKRQSKGVTGALKAWVKEASKEAENKVSDYMKEKNGLGAVGNRDKRFVKAAESYERRRRKELEADKNFRGQ